MEVSRWVSLHTGVVVRGGGGALLVKLVQEALEVGWACNGIVTVLEADDPFEEI